ncbi:unnamed protein product [Gongylonema pulchrum]|uniref:Transposase n=1 Tax=Gongylonema pulchrum TaxID=637853 RepID=A0A183EA47_9BILA|nr:unnamed protein product [Gongylonema pulchrum]
MNCLICRHFSVQYDSRVIFNVSVDPQAQLVIYGRRTAQPSPTIHDFADIIRAERLAVIRNSSSKSRIRRSLTEQLLRTSILTHYLLAGRWHIGLLNDAAQVT